MEADLIERGQVAFTFEASERFANPFDTVHGGIIATMLDSAMGMAVLTTMPEGAAAPTLSLDVKYLRRVATDAGRLRAEGAVVHIEPAVRNCRGPARRSRRHHPGHSHNDMPSLVTARSFRLKPDQEASL